MTPYPIGTSVRLDTTEQMLDGAVAFVITEAGDWTEAGERVPDEHMEVEVKLVDPAMERGIRHRTIVHESNIAQAYC